MQGITKGLMMDTPLTLTPVLERAARLFPKKSRPALIRGCIATHSPIFMRVCIAWRGLWNAWA